MRPELVPYLDLMRGFGERRISASEFETKFLALYKNDATNWSEREFRALDELFGAVDAFCGDDSLRDDEDIDEEQLLGYVALAWKKLS